MEEVRHNESDYESEDHWGYSGLGLRDRELDAGQRFVDHTAPMRYSEKFQSGVK